jgi:flavin reductase (DIM6/NTAB) family NADH-FMN oxidoreductase RutF
MEFDLERLAPRDAYRLLIGTVVPRPIAFVTSVDREGRVNAAPYSFFNAVSDDPPLVVIGAGARPDRTDKDTAANIRSAEEFTVNIVDEALAEAMNVGAVPFPPGVDELAEAGLTALPGARVRSPRIAEAPASLECRRFVTLEVGAGRSIVFGRVVYLHYRDGVVVGGPERPRVDPARLGAVGRLGGAGGYATTRDRFEMPRMTVAEWEARRAAMRAAGDRRSGGE